MQLWERLKNFVTICGGQHLVAEFANLRRVCTDPHAADFRAGVPECDVLFEVAVAMEHGPSNGPVNVYATAFNVLQDALVGGGLAAFVVMFGESVNGDGDGEIGNVLPLHGNGNDSAGDDHSVHTHGGEFGQYAREFFMAYERFAADERNMKRFVTTNSVEDAVDEIVSAFVVEGARRTPPARCSSLYA